jgi:hypothetical protein
MCALISNSDKLVMQYSNLLAPLSQAKVSSITELDKRTYKSLNLTISFLWAICLYATALNTEPQNYIENIRTIY